jgi:aryl-alcohol dehydrogenase-like predicted oxidoreductase
MAHVSLALGAMNFGKRTPEADAKRIVHRALDAGITLFDTANAYSDGESERVLGRLLAGQRDRVEIATKVGFGRLAGKLEGLSPERVRASLDESLARLGTDRVDLYYLHVPDYATPIEATLEAMKSALDGGKARAWGVSNFASWQILEMMTIADRTGMPRPKVSQQMYNVLVRQLDIEYFKFARRYPIHTTVYNPLAGGLLSGKPGRRFENNALYQRRYLTKTMRDATSKLERVANDAGITLVALAYRWIVGRAGVDSILVGPGSLEHLEAALSACASPLDESVRAKVDQVWLEMVGTDATYAR